MFHFMNGPGMMGVSAGLGHTTVAVPDALAVEIPPSTPSVASFRALEGTELRLRAQVQATEHEMHEIVAWQHGMQKRESDEMQMFTSEMNARTRERDREARGIEADLREQVAKAARDLADERARTYAMSSQNGASLVEADERATMGMRIMRDQF